MNLKKRLGSLLLVLTMLLALVPLPAQAAGFRDTQGHWAEADIDMAVEQGLFTGTSATTFSPNASMTRAMFVTVLYRMDDGSALEDASFIDIDPSAWYYDAVCWASENGLVSGTDARHFAPNQKITREQMVTILYRYLNYLEAALEHTSDQAIQFTDQSKISAYARDAVTEMQLAGVVGGKPAGTGYRFDPQGNATRAEAARVFCLFLDRIYWGEEELTPEEASQRIEEILSDEELSGIAEKWQRASTDAARQKYVDEAVEYFEQLNDAEEIERLSVDRENQTVSFTVGGLESCYLLYDPAENITGAAAMPESVNTVLAAGTGTAVSGTNLVSSASSIIYKALVLESYPANAASEIAEEFHIRSADYKGLIEDISSSSIQISADVRTGVTVESLKTGLNNYDLIFVNSHGSTSHGTPFIALEEAYSSNKYLKDREENRVLVYGGLSILGDGYFGVRGAFFSYYYDGLERAPLKAQWVHLGTCHGMETNDLAQSFRDAGARFVTGYTDEVALAFDIWCVYYMFDHINEGNTLSAAVAYADPKAREETNDGVKNVVEHRPPLKALGDGSLKLNPFGKDSTPAGTGKLSIELSPDSGTVTKGTVTVYKEDGTTKVGTHTFTTSSFEIGELETGASYKLEIAADGYQPAAVTGKAADNPVTQIVKLTQLEGKISLRLVPDSGTVTGGKVATTKTAGLTSSTSETSDFTGSSFVIGALEPGAQYKVDIAAEGYNAATVTVNAAVNPTVTTVNLTVKADVPILSKTVTVNVKDFDTGAVLSGAAVTLYGGLSSSSLTQLATGTTNSSGVFTTTVPQYFSVYKAEATLDGYVRGSTETSSTTIGVTLSKEPDLTPDPEPDPGVPAGYTPIYTAEEFAALEGNEKVILMKNISFTDTVRGSKYIWSGVLDGNGHTISGVKVDGYTEAAGWINTNSGTIRNVRFQISMQGESTGPSAVIGMNTSSGTIENCVVSGSISASRTSSDGGWVGAAGLVGRNDGVIRNCVNKASVSATATGPAGSSSITAKAAGIAVLNTGEITNCLNLGYISVSSKNFAYAGGVAADQSYTSSGHKSGTVSGCGNGGTVSIAFTNQTGGVTGGFRHPVYMYAEDGYATSLKVNYIGESSSSYEDTDLELVTLEKLYDMWADYL